MKKKFFTFTVHNFEDVKITPSCMLTSNSDMLWKIYITVITADEILNRAYLAGKIETPSMLYELVQIREH